MRISDWSSDVCSSDLAIAVAVGGDAARNRARRRGRRRGGGDFFLLRTGGERQSAKRTEHEGLDTHRPLLLDATGNRFPEACAPPRDFSPARSTPRPPSPRSGGVFERRSAP